MLSLHDWRPDLRLKPSLVMCGSVSAFFVLLLALLPFTHQHGWYQWLVAGCAAACWVYVLYRYVLLQAKRSVTRIQWATDGWFVTTRQKIEGPLVLRSSTRVARSLILLHFGRPPGHPVTRPLRHFTVDFVVPVLPDSLDQESYRALQIFLRWQRAAVLNPLLAPEKGS